MENKPSVYGQTNCILPRSFFDGRDTIKMHKDSRDYKVWWREQIRRCKEGFSDGGFYVPGTYYFHLNFFNINMWGDDDNPKLGNPYFSQED